MICFGDIWHKYHLWFQNCLKFHLPNGSWTISKHHLWYLCQISLQIILKGKKEGGSLSWKGELHNFSFQRTVILFQLNLFTQMLDSAIQHLSNRKTATTEQNLLFLFACHVGWLRLFSKEIFPNCEENLYFVWKHLWYYSLELLQFVCWWANLQTDSWILGREGELAI